MIWKAFVKFKTYINEGRRNVTIGSHLKYKQNPSFLFNSFNCIYFCFGRGMEHEGGSSAPTSPFWAGREEEEMPDFKMFYLTGCHFELLYLCAD